MREFVNKAIVKGKTGPEWFWVRKMISTESFFHLIKQGEIEQVKTALSEDPSLVNSQEGDGSSAVLIAAYYHQPAIARLLVKYGAALNVFEASAIGAAKEVQEMIAGDSSMVNAIAADGFQPLGLACFFGYPAVVEILLQAGAAVNQPAYNISHVTPLHSAVAGRNEQIVRRLIDYGADVNVRQSGDFVPLHAAAQNGDVTILQMLLDAKADVNARDSEGKTSLTFAIDEGHLEAVVLLRSRGGLQ